MRHKEVTQSSDRCHPSLLGQSLLAEWKYMYCVPAAHQVSAEHWAHTEYFHWGILGGQEENVCGRNVAQPAKAGPGLGDGGHRGECLQSEFPQAWA